MWVNVFCCKNGIGEKVGRGGAFCVPRFSWSGGNLLNKGTDRGGVYVLGFYDGVGERTSGFGLGILCETSNESYLQNLAAQERYRAGYVEYWVKQLC